MCNKCSAYFYVHNIVIHSAADVVGRLLVGW